MNVESSKVLHQTADNESKSRLVVVLASCDDIPFLARTSIARLDLDWSQVLPEVP
jgi:hypothetical protein